MSVLIRQSGNVDAGDDYPGMGKNAMLPATDGTCFAIVFDANDATGGGDDTDIAKCYVYQSNALRTTWTLRATVTGFSALKRPFRFSADLYSDNSIGIVVVGNTVTQFVKVTYGTWAVSALETVATHSGLGTGVIMQCVDISISSDNCVAVGAQWTLPAAPYQVGAVFVKATTGGAWVQAHTQTLYNSPPVTMIWDCAFTWMKGGTSTSRPWVAAWSVATAGTDGGVSVYTGRANQVTGAAVVAITFRQNYAIGSINVNTTSLAQPTRQSWLVSEGTNGWRLGITTTLSSVATTYAIGGTWDGTTWAVTHNTSAKATYPYTYRYGFGCSYSNDTFIFFGLYIWSSASYYLMHHGMRFNADGTVKVMPQSMTDDRGSLLFRYPQGAVGRNADQDYGTWDIMVHKRLSATNYQAWGTWMLPMRAPAGVSPSAGSTTTSSVPPVSAAADLDVAVPQANIRIRWQFASDASFTTNLRTYTQDESKSVPVEGTNFGATSVLFQDVLPVIYSMPQGTWYVRAAHVNDYGIVSAYTPGQSFTISHPPSATDFDPVAFKTVSYQASGVLCSWTFTDPSSDDYQTAYKIDVYRVSDNALVATTGKVTSTDEFGVVIVPSGEKDKNLYWKLTPYDRDDVAGAQVGNGSFVMVDPPSVVINTPTNGATLTSGLLNVQITPTVGGTRLIKQFRILIQQGSTLVHDSGFLNTGNTASGVAINYTPANTLPYKNNQTYSITAIVRDTLGLEAQAVIGVSTAWTPPAAASGVAASITNYNVEDAGYTTITWTDTNRDTDFRSWVIYRKSDELDPNTGAVLVAGSYVQIDEIFEPGATYTRRDYGAPSGYKSYYYVAQRIDKFGDVVESETVTAVNVTPKSDGYWLISTLSATDVYDAFKLGIVTGDEYTEEYEENEFTIVGRGRHVERGEALGKNGTLTLQLRDTTGNSARMKKRRLELMKEANTNLYLRTPFGDAFLVNAGNVGVSRIAGVGLSEFCDVTIPYKEVGS